MLIVGGGVSGDRARAAVAALAAAADAPVVTTWLRKSQFLDDDPHYVGALGYGAHRAAEDAVRTADVVLAVGCRFSEFTTRRWTLVPADATVIQVDVDAEQIGRVLPVAVGIQADAALAAEAIGQAIGRPPRALGRATRRRELRARYEEESVIPGGGPSTSPVPSGALVAELQARSTGTRRCWCRTCTRSGRGSRGTCGSASPTATSPPTAAAWAGACPPRWASRWPGRTGRSSPCSATAASGWSPRTWATIRERLPVVCVVVNNFSFGNTRDRQRLAHGGRYLGVFYDNPDFAAYARLLGAHGERVDKSGDLAGAIDRAVASGRPAVIDVVQDQQEGLPPGLAPPAAHPNPA